MMVAYACYELYVDIYIYIYILLIAWAKPIVYQNWFSLNDKIDKIFINIIMIKEKCILTHLINMRYL